MRRVILILTPILLVVGIAIGLYYRRSSFNIDPPASATPLPVEIRTWITAPNSPKTYYYRVGFIPPEFPKIAVRSEGRSSFSAQKKVYEDGTLLIMAVYWDRYPAESVAQVFASDLTVGGWKFKRTAGALGSIVLHAAHESGEELRIHISSAASGGTRLDMLYSK